MVKANRNRLRNANPATGIMARSKSEELLKSLEENEFNSN